MSLTPSSCASVGGSVAMSSRCPIAAMRACTQRLPWRTSTCGRSTAGSVSSQASVAPKRCAGSSVSGAPIQSPRETSSWRSRIDARPTGRPRPRHARCRRGAARRRWRARRSGRAAPGRRRARGRGRCGPTACAAGGRCRCRRRSRATYCTGSSSEPSMRSCVRRQRFQQLQQRRAAVPGARRSGVVTLSPRSADTGTIAGHRDAGFGGKGLQRRAHRLEGRPRSATRVELVDREDDARHAQQVRQQRVAAGLRQQRHAACACASRSW